jgi:hypothetical protein
MSAALAPGYSSRNPSGRPNATAIAFEDAHRFEPVEHGAIIAPDGHLRLRRVGTRNNLRFAPAELALVQDITFTHNHPESHSFSVEDIELAAEYKMHEIRVVTAGYRHFAWGFARVDHSLVKSEYKQLEPYAQHQVLGRIIAGILNPADAEVEVVHATWERVARSLRFEYRREPS